MTYKNKIIYYFITVLLTSSSGINCSWFKSKIIENIKVEKIKSVTVTKVPIPLISDKTELTFVLSVKNNNLFDITMRKTDFEIFIDDISVGEGKNKTEQVLSSNSLSDVSIGYSSDSKGILINGISLVDIIISGKEHKIRLIGELTTLSEDKEYVVPFEIEDFKKLIR